MPVQHILNKGGDPSAGSPTDTLLQLSPSHNIRNRNPNWFGTAHPDTIQLA